MRSIFREEKKIQKEPRFKEITNFSIVTHDEGVPRARKYSLNDQLYFSEFSGFKIKDLIETNFNFFTWLPRKIENFTYQDEVIKYAEQCLEFLEKIDRYSFSKRHDKLSLAISQVDNMLRYEHELDFGNENRKLYYKSLINVPFYKKIDKITEKLIRQALEIEQTSPEYRRKYFEEVKSKYK